MTMESITTEHLQTPSSSPAPSTPEYAPSVARDAHPGVRRVHTLPAKLARNASRVAANANIEPAPDAVETLFVHPAAKIVSFTVAGGNTRPDSSAGRRSSLADVSASGTLSWELPSERTMAAGQMKIYRVPSSGVSFLNSGLLLHPILQRSQCWLVDEQSKFVLRVREGSYYRIELPFATDEDKAAVEEFKKVLSTVLQYEKTSSPFRRGYVPETLEVPKTPVNKSTRPREKAKKWRLNKVWEPEDPEHRARLSPSNKEEDGPASWRKHLRSRSTTLATTIEVSDSTSSQETTEDEGTMTDDSAAEGSQRDDLPELPSLGAQHHGSPQTPRIFTLPLRPRPDAIRSITAPPQLALDIGSGSSMRSLSRSTSQESDAASIASSRDSFYSADEPVIALESADTTEHVPDLISDEHMDTIKGVRTNHQRQISEITITPSTPTPLTARTVLSEDAQEPSGPSTPTLISDSDEDHDLPFIDAVTPPDTIRLRKMHPRISDASDEQQALQPLHSPNHFFTSQAPSRKRAISAALVQKAYSLLVGPPSHLVSLMLDIAARIVRSMQGAKDMRRRIPGAWDSSAEEEDEWDEDDFGIPLDNLRRDSARSESRPSLRGSRAPSVASSDYDALIEGPLLSRVASRRSSGSLD
jgi:hypothetical protein